MSRLHALDLDTYRLPAEVAARLQSPALVVNLELVRHNLARMLELLGGAVERWRPHVKTTKLPVVWDELLRIGVRHFKCATTREADQLARTLVAAGVEGGDVLLAYPLIGPGLERLAGLARSFPGVRFSVLVEDPAAVANVPTELGLFIDLEPGMGRTGIDPGNEAGLLALAAAANRERPRLRGLHHYDGHLHDPDPTERRERAWRGYRRLLELADLLESHGHPIEELITSGTPAFSAALAFEPFDAPPARVHRVSPGTVVFHDLRSEEENPELGLLPAAVVFSRVVSHPTPGSVTADAGSKALAAEAGDPAAIAIGWPGLVGGPQSEEHLPLQVSSGDTPARGTELYLVARHICPTVNLAEAVLLIDGELPPRVVEVSARAHELLLPGS